jgi:hypothetical protein
MNEVDILNNTIHNLQKDISIIWNWKTINDNVINFENLAIAKQWIRNKDWSLEYAVEILEELKKGLIEDN